MEVEVKNGDVMRAYRKLKKILHNEGVFAEMQKRRHYVKPSEAKRMKKAEAIRRRKKEDAKRMRERFG